MGQHKYNKTAQLAKENKLPANIPKMSRREFDNMMFNKAREVMLSKYHEWTKI